MGRGAERSDWEDKRDRRGGDDGEGAEEKEGRKWADPSQEIINLCHLLHGQSQCTWMCGMVNERLVINPICGVNPIYGPVYTYTDSRWCCWQGEKYSKAVI